MLWGFKGFCSLPFAVVFFWNVNTCHTSPLAEMTACLKSSRITSPGPAHMGGMHESRPSREEKARQALWENAVWGDKTRTGCQARRYQTGVVVSPMHTVKKQFLLHCSCQILSHSDMFHLRVFYEIWYLPMHPCIRTKNRTGVQNHVPSYARKCREETPFHHRPLVFFCPSHDGNPKNLSTSHQSPTFLRTENTRPEEGPSSRPGISHGHTSASRNFTNLSIEISLEKRWCIQTQAKKDDN